MTETQLVELTSDGHLRFEVRPSSKPEGKVSTGPTACDRDYSQMEIASGSSMKRKNAPSNPTVLTTPSKINAAMDHTGSSDLALVEAIQKLTAKMDSFGEQLRENSVMVAGVAKLVNIYAAEIKECKGKVADLEKEIPKLIKEN